MTALAMVACAGLALYGLHLLLLFVAERDKRRHAWRVELVEKRALAWRADELAELKSRVQKLELKVSLR